MKVINRQELKDLILSGITTEELKAYDYSNITDMSFMFTNCKSLTTIPELNTSNVYYMNSMFGNCKLLGIIPELNTSNIKDMSFMFTNCKSLTTIPYLDISRVIEMKHIFYGCISLEHCFYDSRINYNKINSPKLKQNRPEYFI